MGDILQLDILAQRILAHVFQEGIRVSFMYVYPILHIVIGLACESRLGNNGVKHYFSLASEQVSVDGSTICILLKETHIVGYRILQDAG